MLCEDQGQMGAGFLGERASVAVWRSWASKVRQGGCCCDNPVVERWWLDAMGEADYGSILNAEPKGLPDDRVPAVRKRRR